MGHLLYLMFRCDEKFGKFGNFVGTEHSLLSYYGYYYYFHSWLLPLQEHSTTLHKKKKEHSTTNVNALLVLFAIIHPCSHARTRHGASRPSISGSSNPGAAASAPAAGRRAWASPPAASTASSASRSAATPAPSPLPACTSPRSQATPLSLSHLQKQHCASVKTSLIITPTTFTPSDDSFVKHTALLLAVTCKSQEHSYSSVSLHFKLAL